jgi:hypothetical protein
MPGAQEMEKMINQRIDLIVTQFTEQAKEAIFDPPAPTVERAQASTSGGGLFGSLFVTTPRPVRIPPQPVIWMVTCGGDRWHASKTPVLFQASKQKTLGSWICRDAVYA